MSLCPCLSVLILHPTMCSCPNCFDELFYGTVNETKPFLPKLLLDMVFYCNNNNNHNEDIRFGAGVVVEFGVGLGVGVEVGLRVRIGVVFG